MTKEIMLKTRLFNKYDQSIAANEVLGKGEIHFEPITIPLGKDGATETAVLMKVGDGVTAYSGLKYTAARAADVYDWAKDTGLTITKDGEGNVVSGITWDASLNGGNGGIKFSTAAVATSEGLEDLQGRVKDIEDDYVTEAELAAAIADAKKYADDNDDNDNTTYSFSIPTTGDNAGKLVITPSEGEATILDLITPKELGDILANYATKKYVDDAVAPLATKAELQAAIQPIAGTYATKAELQAEAQTRSNADLALDGKIAEEARLRAAADADLEEKIKKYADDNDTNTTYTFSIPTENENENKGKLVITPSEGDKIVLDIVTPEELDESKYDDTEVKNRLEAIEKDYLKEADKVELSTEISAVEGVANAAKAAIDAFLDESAVSDEVVNTLKEIQEGLDAGEASAANLLKEINTLKTNKADASALNDAVNTLNGSIATAKSEAISEIKGFYTGSDAIKVGTDGVISIAGYDSGITFVLNAN